MTKALAAVLEQFSRLSADEKAEFLSLAADLPPQSVDWDDEDATLAAVQTFSRLDAEEEDGGK